MRGRGYAKDKRGVYIGGLVINNQLLMNMTRCRGIKKGKP